MIEPQMEDEIDTGGILGIYIYIYMEIWKDLPVVSRA